MRITITSNEGEKTIVETETIAIEGVTKFYCLSCNRFTNQKKIWEKEIEDDSDWEDFGVVFSTIFELFTCLGCDDATLRKMDSVSEEWVEVEKGKGRFIGKFTYFPNRKEGMVHPKQEVFYAPTKVKKIYNETIEAYNNGQFCLCAIGIRAIIEAICIEENINISGLDKKIEELIEKRIVTPKIGEGLQENRLLGNDSAHKLEIFGERELLIGIKLIESVIESHYASTNKIEFLKKRRQKTVEKG